MPTLSQEDKAALFVTTVPVTLELFLAPFAAHFRSRGWRVDALANGACADEALAASFDHRYDVAWRRDPFAPGNLIGSARQVRRIVREGGYDVVHVHTPIAAFVTRFALRRIRRRPGGPVVIYTAHGFHFFEDGPRVQNALFRMMESLASRWTDYLVTINDEDRRAALAMGGIPPQRVRLIPGIGVDSRSFARVPEEEARRVRDELVIPPDAFVVTVVAEFAPVKRHAHMLDALALVTDPRVVLVLVGTGPLEDRVRAEVAARGLSERVRFAGYRRDVPAVLAASDAVMLASEREGLPRSVLEGMAAGKPVVGTRTRGIPDAVGPDAGWIVDKHDAAALAAAVDAAAADRAEARRRGEAGRRRVEERFALPRVIDAYEELYGEALASCV